MAFYDAVVGGVDFGKKIRDDHPNITKENHNEYIDDFYVKHIYEFKKALKDTELCFQEIKNVLFLELQKYFGQDYSKEKNTCYLSIFNCNPRYLENKSFQVYYRRSREMRKEVIAHELTHFAFYDFCHKLGIKDSNTLWELSEIFNVIFLNLPSIRKVIGVEEFLFYPKLKNKLEVIKTIWEKQPNTKKFITESLLYLQNALEFPSPSPLHKKTPNGDF